MEQLLLLPGNNVESERTTSHHWHIIFCSMSTKLATCTTNATASRVHDTNRLHVPQLAIQLPTYLQERGGSRRFTNKNQGRCCGSPHSQGSRSCSMIETSIMPVAGSLRIVSHKWAGNRPCMHADQDGATHLPKAGFGDYLLLQRDAAAHWPSRQSSAGGNLLALCRALHSECCSWQSAWSSLQYFQ
jgi:hypothetical protein